MHLINGKPWIDLEPFVDMDSLEKQRHKFALAIAMHPDQIDTAVVGEQKTLFDQSEIELAELASTIVNNSDVDKDALAKIKNMVRFYTYVKYMYPTITLGQCMHIRTMSRYQYQMKHKRDRCVDTPLTESFQFFLDWLDQQHIFSEYGRIILFLNEPGTTVPMHRDYSNPNSYQNQFIWISLGNQKDFFVMDANGNKHQIVSRCATFDNANYHGSNVCKYASWSLRVDGIFSDDMLDRSGLRSHYKL